MSTLVVLIVLFLLLAIGTPVGFSMAIAGALGLSLVGGVDLIFGILRTTPLSTVQSYELLTIPLFILMAEFVLASGIADDLFKAAAAWFGRVRGGLAMATAVAGAGFGAICGSSTASAATLSSTSLPAMIKQGYEPKLAAGVVAISGTLAMLIPPSVALVIYGLLAQVNIGKLLIGGIIPGIFVTLVIIATVWLQVWQDPSRAPASAVRGWGEKMRMLAGVWPMLALFGTVTAVIYTGIATPTEASAIGAFGALLLAIGFTRTPPVALMQAARRASYSSCMIVMILIGAHVFGYFMTLTQVPQSMIAWVSGLDIPAWTVLAIILTAYIILGAFMDQLAILVLTVPIVLPVIVALGYDPLWFGVIAIVTAEVGMVTPPVGLNCFVVSRYAGRPLWEVFHGSFPHIVAHMFVIATLLAFPEIILWLPSRMAH